MSASREKKQRQGSGPSDKAAQARQQKNDYKRKVRTYTIIGVVVVVLVAALLIWNSDFVQSRKTAATVGNRNVSIAELSYYYQDARYMYAYYGSMIGFDTSKSDDAQYFNEADGVTYRDHFLETALASLQNTDALYDAAIAAGYSKDSVKESLANEIDSTKAVASAYGLSYKAYLKRSYGQYMTIGAYENVLTRVLIASLYSSDHRDELRPSYADADLEAYYSEHADSMDVIDYSYLFFAADPVVTNDTDGNTLSEDEIAAQRTEVMAAAKEKADAALAAYQGSSSVSNVIRLSSPTSSQEHASANGTSAVSSIYRDQLLALGANEAAVVEAENSGYYLVVFHSRGRDEALRANVRHILVRAETTTAEDGSVVAPSEEEWASVRQEAERILAEYQNGAHTADAFAALANQYSADGDGTTGGLYEDISHNSTTYVSEFMDWIFEDGRQVGDVGIARHEGSVSGSNQYWGDHVMYLDSYNEAEWAYAARSSLTSEAMSDWTTGLRENGSYETALAGAADKLGR